ncbi:MAG: endonuclease/exonuclease/phosphatase family protein [Gammaproteobacteria bacterium]|nr:endonuclease/exonuclease/phosphatase family protein [Gammaproteobacteria bacterium]
MLTIASYNIHGCIGKDRARDVDRIVRVIHELEADIVGLQEVDTHSGPGLDSAQMDYLPHATGLNAVRGPLLARHHGHYGNLLLTSLPVADVRHIDLTVGRHEPRGALDVDLRFGEHLVRVVVTHFGLVPWERRKQGRRLLEALAPAPEKLLVLMGDFNAWRPASGALSGLHAALGSQPAPATYPAFFPLLPLDRILVSPREALIGLHTHTTTLTQVCSDHLPLRAAVQWPPVGDETAA